jgi:hypothetical protein
MGLTIFCLSPAVEMQPFYSVMPVMGPALLLKGLLKGRIPAGDVMPRRCWSRRWAQPDRAVGHRSIRRGMLCSVKPNDSICGSGPPSAADKG